jgi:hypothetical protein
VTDQEYLAEVVSWLDTIIRNQAELERLFRTEMEAYAAICKALDHNEDQYLPALRREYERACAATKRVGTQQSQDFGSLESLLYEWRSPGRDFAGFRNEAVRVTEPYIETFNHLADTHRAMRTELANSL